MEEKYLIRHKEIAGLGYYFLDRKQEDLFLKSMNEELAFRVGEEILRKLPDHKSGDPCYAPGSETLCLHRDHGPVMEETVSRIRKDLLQEAKKNRKRILTETAVL